MNIAHYRTTSINNHTQRGIIFDDDLDMEDEQIPVPRPGGCHSKEDHGEREQLPEFTYMGWSRFWCQIHTPDPIRSYKCQKYWHKAITCHQQEKCPICAGKHNAKNCDKVSKEPESGFQRSDDSRCANCGGEHPVLYRSGPEYQDQSHRANQNQRSKPARQPESTIIASAPTRISYADAARRQKTKQPGAVKTNQATSREDGSCNMSKEKIIYFLCVF